MTTPIRAKPRASMKIDNAPTPHNTPASVLSSSYLKNGIPSLNNNNNNNNSTTERGAAGGGGAFASLAKSGIIPQTIHEEDLLHSIQDKLGSLIGTDSGYIDSLPKKVKQRVWALSALQQQLFQLEREFQIEMFELEQKYLGLYAPVFEKRAKIVGGELEPTEEEIKEGELLAKEGAEEEQEKEEKEEDGEKEEEEEEELSDAKGIPAFWLTALENLPIVNETITDRDAEVLEHLTDIKLQYLESGKPGFKLVFEFNTDTNTYFSNPTLTKTYYYQSELGYSGDFIYDHAEGEEIKWLSNAVNVTVLVETRKQRNKHTKQIRTIERLTPVESFFNFFDPPSVADNNDDDNDDKDADTKKNKVNGGEAEEEEDEDDDLEARLALDYSIGEQIKDKLIPRAVDWFTGAALEFEFMDESEEDDDDDDEDEGEFDDEDEDDDEGQESEEHDDFKGVKEEPPECKQQ